MAPKSKKQPETTSGDGRHDKITLEQREKLLAAARNECNAHLKLAKAARLDLPEGTTDPSLVGQVNSLAKSVAILSAECRQLEKHREAAVENLDAETTDRMVLEFLDEVSPSRRQAFRKHLDDTSPGDTLLGH